MKRAFEALTKGQRLIFTLLTLCAIAAALHLLGLDAGASTLPVIMFGMAEIKSAAAIRDKWTRVTPTRQEDYKTGVSNPRRDWATEATAGKQNWKAGVDAAAQKDMYAKGIEGAGTAKWKSKALAKGPGRFAEGVYGAGGDYEKGFAPFREAIAGVDLGPKFPRRDPRNLDRVKKVVDAVVARKMGA